MTAKRKRVAAGAKGKTAQKATTAPDTDDMLTTAIHIPRATHLLLRAVAFRRAQEGGGRPSVSALLVEIVEERREELVKEAGPYLG